MFGLFKQENIQINKNQSRNSTPLHPQNWRIVMQLGQFTSKIEKKPNMVWDAQFLGNVSQYNTCVCEKTCVQSFVPEITAWSLNHWLCFEQLHVGNISFLENKHSRKEAYARGGRTGCKY